MNNRFYGEFDTERLSGRRDDDDFRTPFQIDRDRILHTPSFRRLQNKTQVFWSGEYDFYRTRLTHSLEVAQIGRSICQWLKTRKEGPLSEEFFIDPDLVEAVCLSHDLGHPPFGHAGERTLNHLMRDLGGFEGNAQTLRLLTDRIFSSRRTGMDPTRAFTDGVLKYKSLWSERCGPDGERPHHHFLYDEQAPHLLWTLGTKTLPPEPERVALKSVECAVMDWADDTAYSLNDIADSVRAGFLGVRSVEEWAAANNQTIEEGSPLGDLLRAIRRRSVEPFVGRRIGIYIRATSLRERALPSAPDSQRHGFELVIDPQWKMESALFKKLAFEVVFLSPQLKQLEHKGSRMLRSLWEVFGERYLGAGRIDGQDFQLLPADTAAEIAAETLPQQRARLVCDFIAGMTDGYAARTYKRLFSPDFGSFSDPVG